MDKVRSGSFDRVVTIEVNNPISLDTHNNPVINWEPFMTNVPCNISYLKGGEKVQSDEVTAENDKRLIMRYVKNLKEDMRILEKDENGDFIYYDILLKQEIGRRRGLNLTIRKKDNAQH